MIDFATFVRDKGDLSVHYFIEKLGLRLREYLEFTLAGYLYQQDRQNPHQARAIARRELPNLLHAVHASLDAGEPEGVDFADSVNLFLDMFGFKRESEVLVAKAQAAAGEPGSQTWYLVQSNY